MIEEMAVYKGYLRALMRQLKALKEALKNKDEGLFSIFLGLENGAAISNSFEKLNYLYDRGIRYVTLCHARDNSICDSSASRQKRC